MKEKLDKFLDNMQENDAKNIEYEWRLVKPSKKDSIKGFIISLIFFLVSLLLMYSSLLGIFVIIIAFCIMVYFGYNLFSKVGIGMPKRVPKVSEEEE